MTPSSSARSYYALRKTRMRPRASPNEYGKRYIMDFVLARNDRRADVRCVWIVLPDERFPRLVTWYVLLK